MDKAKLDRTNSRLQKRKYALEARGLSADYLKAEYIEKDRSLGSIADELEVGVKLLRNALAFFEIKKPKEVWQAKGSENLRRIDKSPDSNWAKSLTPEIRAEARARGAATRAREYTQALESQGITLDSLYALYITDNKSLSQLAEHFSVTEWQIRSWLKRFNIVKSQELRDEARKIGINELFNDPQRTQELVTKAQTTMRERYGNKWYRVTASKEETALADALAKLFPDVTMARSDYSVIHKGGTGGALQLDIYLPELKLAIEYNGEHWHDRAAYEADLINGTKLTRESLKDELCAAKGLKLLHVWSGDWKREPEVVLQVLTNEILGRMNSGDDLSGE